MSPMKCSDTITHCEMLSYQAFQMPESIQYTSTCENTFLALYFVC